MTGYDSEKISLDFFYKNQVKVFQNIKGYRFSVDSPILADFIPFSENTGLEIGSGSGIISILLLHKKKLPGITGIEIQKGLCDLSKMSIAENSMSTRFNVINADFNSVYEDFRGIKIIFSNPPFFKIGIGHLSKNEEVKRGKFEVDITLKDIVKKSSEILGKKGNIFFILPYQRYGELLDIASDTGLFPVKVREVLSFKNGKPERFLIQLSNYKSDPIKVSPLIIYHSVGKYSDEMEDILAGR